MSTGIRFTTLPDVTPPSQPLLEPLSPTSSPSSSSLPSNPLPSQPPTTITALFNPITGHILTAYAARVSRDLALCSRFAFNINSYESEWTLGAEWWVRGRVPGFGSGLLPHDIAPLDDDDHEPPSLLPPREPTPQQDEIQGVVKARISTSAVCNLPRVLASLVSRGTAERTTIIGYRIHVGRPLAQRPRQPRRYLEPFEPLKTHHRNRP